MRKIKIFFRNHFVGLSNLLKWFKAIYNDRDWDYEYAERIVYFKLKRMYNRFNSDKSPADWTYKPEALKALKISLSILKRREENWYWNLGTEEQQAEQKDWKLFCRILEKYFHFWWD